MELSKKKKKNDGTKWHRGGMKKRDDNKDPKLFHAFVQRASQLVTPVILSLPRRLCQILFLVSNRAHQLSKGPGTDSRAPTTSRRSTFRDFVPNYIIISRARRSAFANDGEAFDDELEPWSLVGLFARCLTTDRRSQWPHWKSFVRRCPFRSNERTRYFFEWGFRRWLLPAFVHVRLNSFPRCLGFHFVRKMEHSGLPRTDGHLYSLSLTSIIFERTICWLREWTMLFLLWLLTCNCERLGTWFE